ncbi:DNA adenine methylase [Escherichia coli]|nr:DNA adenine methylase [Escherichia coli]
MSTILKWAGNKTAIMSELKKHLPAGPRLVEPFAGSCAVMMETDYLVGTDENVLVLNRTYANRSNAERAAKMQWERLQRGVASFSLQLAEGRADLYTEMPVKVSGFKQPIDDAEWTITTLTHTVSPDNGFTTSIELEVKIDDLEME